MSQAVLKLNSDHYTIVALYPLIVCTFFVINRPSPWRPPVYKMNTVFRESKLA